MEWFCLLFGVVAAYGAYRSITGWEPWYDRLMCAAGGTLSASVFVFLVWYSVNTLYTWEVVTACCLGIMAVYAPFLFPILREAFSDIWKAWHSGNFIYALAGVFMLLLPLFSLAGAVFVWLNLPMILETAQAVN